MESRNEIVARDTPWENEQRIAEREPYVPDALARQIDRYEKNLAMLRSRLTPVLSQHAVTYAEPHPEQVAEHQLHEQLNRLESANQGLETLIGEIAL